MTALPAAPAPGGVHVEASTDTSVEIHWNSVTHTTKYRVQYRQGGTGSWRTATSSVTGTEYTVTGLSCGTAYQFQVAAYGDGSTYGSAFGPNSTALNGSTSVCPDPVFQNEPYAFEVRETAAVGTAVGTVSATDPTPNDVLTFSITGGSTGSAFALGSSDGRITVAGGLDQGVRPSYNLQVRVTDSADYTDNSTVAITVLENVAPAPENLRVHQQSRNTITLEWDLVDNSTKYRVQYRRTGRSAWTTSTDEVTTTRHEVTGLTCGQAYQFRVTAYGDGVNYSEKWGMSTQPLDTTGSDCERPSFTADNYSFEVRNTAGIGLTIGTVEATDVTQGETLTYAITAGNNSGRFSVSSDTGQITVAQALGDPSTYRLTLQVTDSQGQSDTARVSIAVLENVAPAPENLRVHQTSRNSVTLEWSSVANATKYRVQYRRTGGSSWRTSSDQVTDTRHEVTGLTCEDDYEFRVSAYGDGTNYSAKWGIDTQPLDASAGDCEEPTFTSESFSFEITNTFSIGAAVGTAGATDITPGDTLTYSITSGNSSGKFGIISDTGQITVAQDLGEPSSYTLTVQVSDTQGQSDTATVSITVLDNPAPAPRVITLVDRSLQIVVLWYDVPLVEEYRVEYRKAGTTDPWTEAVVTFCTATG